MLVVAIVLLLIAIVLYVIPATRPVAHWMALAALAVFVVWLIMLVVDAGEAEAGAIVALI